MIDIKYNYWYQITILKKYNYLNKWAMAFFNNDITDKINKWLILNRIICVSVTWNHLTVCKQMISNSFKNKLLYKRFTQKSHKNIYSK